MASIASIGRAAVAVKPSRNVNGLRISARSIPSTVKTPSSCLPVRTVVAVFPSREIIKRQRATVIVHAADAKKEDALENFAIKVFGEKFGPKAVTLGFIALWYALNIGFNLQNKVIFKYFPYPYTVSTVHVIVGTIYCALMYAIGQKKASFERPVTAKEFGIIFWPAAMHAIGHVAANISFAAVAISLTHTVKTLEPAFNVFFKWLLIGQGTPVPVMLTLVPIMLGVGLASAAELSFNWLGFISAMLSNVTFGLRAVLGKGAMKFIGSTGVYAYTTLISMLICAPLALLVEGPTLLAGIDKAIATVGAQSFWTSLVSVGLLYHLYNQFAFNTLERVDPVAHGVCNVVKRVAIIATSVVFFGNTLTTQTKIGTAVAILGTWLYTEAEEKSKHKKSGGSDPTPKPA